MRMASTIFITIRAVGRVGCVGGYICETTKNCRPPPFISTTVAAVQAAITKRKNVSVSQKRKGKERSG